MVEQRPRGDDRLDSGNEIGEIFVTDLHEIRPGQDAPDARDIGVAIRDDQRAAVHINHHDTVISNVCNHSFDRVRHWL